MTKFMKEFLKKHKATNRKPNTIKKSHPYKNKYTPVQNINFNAHDEYLPKRMTIPLAVKKNAFKIDGMTRGRKNYAK